MSMERPDGHAGEYHGVIHMHSNYSHDSKDPLEVLRDTSIQRGIRFVGMSEHAEDLTEEIFAKYVAHCDAVSNTQVQIIPGLEFRFAGLKGMHLFALGLRTWITPTTPDAFIEQTRGVAQMTVLAHPVLAKYNIPTVVLEHIDAIEVWNANYNTRYLPDPRAIQLFHEVYRRRPQVVATVGLDQHDASNDRETRVVLPHPSPNPLAEIKAGRFTNRGKTMQFDARASFSTPYLFGLRGVRGFYDIVEHTQDRMVRVLRPKKKDS
jgi:hypothetical protein